MNDDTADQDNTDAYPFDFDAHRKAAVSEYLQNREFFDALAHAVQRIVHECLRLKHIKISSVECRAKSALSFEQKAGTPSTSDPSVPKYSDPFRQITDLAGVRVITFFPRSLEDIDKVLTEEFEIVERSDKGAALVEEERFGYQSIHYLVKLRSTRTQLPEYGHFADALTEIQVRTILQHAWAEIEHDIQYKSASVIPTEIRRRFMALAGLLDLADREFQAIQNEDSEITEKARTSIEHGDLEVEITPGALKTYLDRRLGVDGRVAAYSYEWMAKVLKSLGFRTLRQVDACIDGYNDDRVSRVAEGNRQGQITRFEHMLLASMGEKFIDRHLFAGEDWFEERTREILGRFRDQDVPVGGYDPLASSVL